MKNIISTLVLSPLVFLTACIPSKKGVEQPKNTGKPVSVQDVMDAPVPKIDESKLTDIEKSKYACIQSTCGDRYVFQNEYEKNPALLDSNKAIVQQKLDRKIQLYMGQVIKNEELVFNLSQKVFSQKYSNLNFSKEQLSIINGLNLGNQLNNYYSALEVNKGGDYFFNHEKLKKSHPKLTVNEIQALDILVKLIGLKSGADYAKIYLERLISMTVTAMPSLEKYDRKQLESVIVKKLAIEGLDPVFKKLQTLIYLSLGSSDSVYLIEKAKQTVDLTEPEKMQIIDYYLSLEGFRVLLDPKNVEIFSQLPLDVGSYVEKTKSLFFNSPAYQQFKNKQDLSQTFQKAKDACLVSLSKSLSNTPTELENQKAKALLHKIQTQSQKIIEEKSKKSLEQPLNIQISLPADQNESLASWDLLFDLATKSYLAKGEELKAIDTNKNENLIRFLIAAQVKYSSNKEFFESVTKVCEQTQPAFLNDAAMFTANLFQASWVTVKNLDYGMGIMAHEIGHIISRKWSDLFSSEKSCLSQIYRNELRTEEDFADLFASHVLNQFQKEDPSLKKNNMICGFPSIGKLNFKYLDTAPTAGDVHSSDFFRLLAVNSATGLMTPACQQHIEKFETQGALFKNYCTIQE